MVADFGTIAMETYQKAREGKRRDGKGVKRKGRCRDRLERRHVGKKKGPCGS